MRDLVAPAQQGDARADLLAGVHQLALRYSRARLGQFGRHDTAADVAQEVCVAVLKALPRYTDRGLPFEAFVYRIAANKVADAQRVLLRGELLTDEVPETHDTAAGPEEEALRSDQARRVWALMERLSEQQREILTLRVAVGMSAEETAEAMGMTAGAVRVAQHRALAKLREMTTTEGVDL